MLCITFINQLLRNGLWIGDICLKLRIVFEQFFGSRLGYILRFSFLVELNYLVGLPDRLLFFFLFVLNFLFDVGLFNALTHLHKPRNIFVSFQFITQKLGDFIEFILSGIVSCCFVMTINMSYLGSLFNQQFAHLEMTFFCCIVKGSLICELVYMVDSFLIKRKIHFVAYFFTISSLFSLTA